MHRCMIIMIFPNFFVSQIEGDQGEEKEEEAGDRRKGGQTGTPTPDEVAPTGPPRSRVSDARNRRINMDGGVGFYSTGGAEGNKD